MLKVLKNTGSATSHPRGRDWKLSVGETSRDFALIARAVLARRSAARGGVTFPVHVMVEPEMPSHFEPIRASYHKREMKI